MGKSVDILGQCMSHFLQLAYTTSQPARHKAFYFEEKCRQPNTVNDAMSWSCVILGVSLVWILTIIVHLGVTLIGASDYTLFYHSNTSTCLVVQRSDRGYIISAMWIFTTSLALVMAFVYAKRFICELRDTRRNSRFLSLCALGCKASEEVLIVADNLQQTIQRTKAYILFLSCFTITTSPLFIALLIDRKFNFPIYLISALTIFAYFHVILMPVLYILVMKNIIWKLPYDPAKRYYARVGNRLYQK
ncbi:hypothetical protein GJ496_005499 [Pomphorhynchus laevis]|nr:hypothetical protein GJ496_005499 [Pomphorhynchus laevis]